MQLIDFWIVVVQSSWINTLADPYLIIFEDTIFDCNFSREIVQTQHQSLLPEPIFISDQVNKIDWFHKSGYPTKRSFLKLDHMAKSGLANDIVGDVVHPLVWILFFDVLLASDAANLVIGEQVRL